MSLDTTLDDGDASADQLQATFQAGTYTVVRGSPADRRRSPSPFTGATTTGGGGDESTSASTTHQAGEGRGADRPAVLATLNGSVSTRGKLTLTLKGKTVSSLKAGRYKITRARRDRRSAASRSSSSARPATNVTSTKFLGRHTVTLKLTAGQWFYFSPSQKKTDFIVHA